MLFSDQNALARAFHSSQAISGLTHSFYRYPARFSPEFVRYVVNELSRPGDIILDPFMGGGTTIVEALASGRRAIGIDVNSLAQFVTQVKTSPLSNRDSSELLEWSDSLKLTKLNMHDESSEIDRRSSNLPTEAREFFGAALRSLMDLRFPRQQQFARCSLLRIGQWALDKGAFPSFEKMCDKLDREIRSMLTGLGKFTQEAQKAGVHKNKITANRYLMQASIADPTVSKTITDWFGTAKLVVTSPPYPGVHVLYHRWQVSGRRETPAPYWLAGLRDGHGGAYYTMGSRSNYGLQTYFATLREGFEHLKKALSPDATVIQLVAFSDRASQMPWYRDTLAAAGYGEVQISNFLPDGNQIRKVPRRKWYTNITDSDAGREVLMIHRPIT